MSGVRARKLVKMAMETWLPSISKQFQNLILFPARVPKTCLSCKGPDISPNKSKALPSLCLSKRTLNLSIISLLLHGFSPKDSKAMEVQVSGFDRYTDPKEGFTLLKPSSWIKVDKAGATVLFEEGSNTIGVVVNPVRINKLGDFGTPEFVADKLIKAEKRKESTNDAVVIAVRERFDDDGLQRYEFEYELDSTRGGMKRIFSAAFVASKKLYILNITHSDKPESPLDPPTRTMLEQVLRSFDTT